MPIYPKSYIDAFVAKLYGKQSIFITSVLNKDYSNAKKLAFELYNDHPAYLLFYCCINYDDNKQMILNLIKRSKNIDPKLIYMLSKSKNYTFDDLNDFFEKFTGNSFIDCCIKKAKFLKKYIKIEQQNLEVQNELEELLNCIDDFNLYDFAIKNNILLKERNSLNYEWYKIINKDEKAANEMILKLIDFQDIKKLINYYNPINIKDERYKILVEYLNKGYSKELLIRSFNIFKNDKSFLTIKVTLALLIASKNENLLILALYLSEKYQFSDNYEILLINLFLCRYFLLFKDLLIILEKLSVKNIQHHNMAYIWSDPMNVTSTKLVDIIKLFLKEIKSEIDSSEIMIRKFIDSGLISNALSTLDLRNQLFDSVIYKEVKELKILSKDRETLFSRLLGEDCRYIFDKITVSNIRTADGTVDTLLSKASDQFSRKIFENEFLNITDENFILKIERSTLKRAKRNS